MHMYCSMYNISIAVQLFFFFHRKKCSSLLYCIVFIYVHVGLTVDCVLFAARRSNVERVGRLNVLY